MLSPQEQRDRLRLIRSENIGPITYYQFLRHFGGAGRAIEALPDLARRGGRKTRLHICSESEAEAEFEAVARTGARLVFWGEPDYPVALAAVEDAPPIINVKGETALLGRPKIAIVGARNASANGRRLARTIAHDLGQGGMIVVSGLARGIDTAAHHGALESGTIAVVAGGVDVVYPHENADLQARIAATGLVVAENRPGTKPTARHFPRRNRIISGLCAGVIVVEAAPRSGSLITARLALEQGREVFAVPGSPLDPRARGANNLLRQGAVLVESAEDVLQTLEGFLHPPRPLTKEYDPPAQPSLFSQETDTDRLRGGIAAGLGPTPIPVDELVRQSGASPAVVASVLLELELAGRLERHPGNQVSLSVG